MRIIFALALVSVLLSGCASLHVQALSPDGTKVSGEPGIRYYMPRPYLLVTEVPANAAGSNQVQDKAPVNVPPPGKAGAPKKPATDVTKPTTDDKAADNTPASTATTSPPSGTDAGYQHQVEQYQVKLIYLPDMSRPMTITETTGIGSVSLQPTLVDGWMLTSLQGTADSKVSETLSAIASIITAQKGPASGGGGGGGGGGGAGAGKAGAGPQEPKILAPGLYALEYDQSTGVLSHICAVTYFGGASNNSSIKDCSRTLKVPIGAWTPSSQ